jgi:hypothetical protein
MAHGDARGGRWRGNWRMEWVASTLYTTSEHGVSSITTADAHTSAASSRLNWCPRRFKWTRPFRRKTKSGFCACAITFQTQSTVWKGLSHSLLSENKYRLHSRRFWIIALKFQILGALLSWSEHWRCRIIDKRNAKERRRIKDGEGGTRIRNSENYSCYALCILSKRLYLQHYDWQLQAGQCRNY